MVITFYDSSDIQIEDEEDEDGETKRHLCVLKGAAFRAKS